jgi:transcriptional regulator GlxA family with amidase domain
MSGMPADWLGNERILYVVYPKFTALDMVGPHYMLSNLVGSRNHVVARTKAPVTSDTGLVFMPDYDLDSAPADPDIVVIPGGGMGTLEALKDDALIDWIRRIGQGKTLMTSVCTGSLLLGQAGLLRGRRATSHWVARDSLAHFGAIPVAERWVEDGPVITGAGVTAGLDFGLSLVAKRRNDEFARCVQVLAEYDPHPPFQAGTPEKAGPTTMATMNAMFVGFDDHIRHLAERQRR